MLELRILSGYHRGATLPLGGEALSIGGAEDADVVLADPGLAPHHARLSPEGRGWLLAPLDGAVRDDQGNAPQESILLHEGGFARVGPIWLGLHAVGSAWQDPPPEPLDAPPAEATDDELAAADQAADGEPFDAADAADVGDASPQPHSPPPQPQPEAAAVVRRSRGFRVILIPVTAVAVLSAAAAYALTTHPAGPGEEIAAREAAELRRMAALPQRLPQDQLQAALRKRLGEIDLLWRVTLELQDREWTIRGALNDEEAERLQRMMRSFAQRYVIDFPVNVRLGSAESMLPFRISQVISGNDPSIVTDDGRRLYVGDEYRGVRLAAVAGNQLRFTGKHNLDIVW